MDVEQGRHLHGHDGRGAHLSRPPRDLMCGEDRAILTASLDGLTIGHWPNDDEDGFSDAIWDAVTYEPKFDVPYYADRARVMSRVIIEVSQPVAITIAELGTQVYELSRRVKRLERKIQRMENP